MQVVTRVRALGQALVEADIHVSHLEPLKIVIPGLAAEKENNTQTNEDLIDMTKNNEDKKNERKDNGKGNGKRLRIRPKKKMTKQEVIKARRLKRERRLRKTPKQNQKKTQRTESNKGK